MQEPAKNAAPSPTPTPTPPHTLKARVVSEFKQFLVLFLYLWVLFGLLVLHEMVVLREHGVEFTHYGFAFINAFVLGKVMLVAEKLRVGGRWADHHPLYYPIAAKAVAFAAVFALFRVAESLIVGLIKGKPLSDCFPLIGGGGLFGILCAGTIVAFALVPYFAFTEIGRVIGKGVLREMILKGRAAA